MELVVDASFKCHGDLIDSMALLWNSWIFLIKMHRRRRKKDDIFCTSGVQPF